MHCRIFFSSSILSQVVRQISLEKDIGIVLLTIYLTRHTRNLILMGVWNANGYFSSGWTYIYPEGYCFDFDEGRQRKSGCCLTVSDYVKKCQQVITYCVVASVQVPMNASSLQGGTDTFFVNFEMISQIAYLISWDA